ncbi:MAG: YeeE/YedE family protein, partial [Chitinophagaceae bacterium]|nr:YeeE/YedE family protein [Chitinophagaceae bacterium]
MLDFLKQPWPWYVAGPLIGLMVPALLIIGNKSFGISSSLRHVCAACVPAKIPFFQYDWKKEIWNLFFVAGIVGGGFLAVSLLGNPDPIQVNPKLQAELASYGVT